MTLKNIDLLQEITQVLSVHLALMYKIAFFLGQRTVPDRQPINSHFTIEAG